MSSFLLYGRQDIDESDVELVAKVLRSPWLTTGPMVERFEEAIRERIGARHAVACVNGTAALHLAALGAGLSPGDTAIVPAITFQATASMVLATGADVVFADVDADTGLMTAEHLEEAIDRAAKALPGQPVRCCLPVHLAGRAADLAGIARIAQRHGMTIVEDAAHAVGTVSDHSIGSCRYSLATAFSFHPVKTITTGEGGVVTTNNDGLAGRIRRLRNHGIVRESEKFSDHVAGFEDRSAAPWYYEIDEIGFNYRLTDIQCALGLSQIGRLDRYVDRRAKIHRQYTDAFRDLNGIQFVGDKQGETTSWHLAVALIDFDMFGRTRTSIMRKLAEHGIGTQVHYIPVYRHPVFRRRYGEQRLPGAESYYARTLSLPIHPRMANEDPARVVEALRDALG